MEVEVVLLYDLVEEVVDLNVHYYYLQVEVEVDLNVQ